MVSKHKSLYNSKAWQRLRYYHLQANPLCKYCNDLGRLTPATVVDHLVPHKGNEHLFYNGQLTSLCKMCHDKTKQLLEKTGVLIGGDKNGMPIDENHHWNKKR